MISGHHLNGNPNGEWKYFYENGSTLRSQTFYDERGYKDSIWTGYSESGVITSQIGV